MSLLEQIQGFKKGALKPTITIVRTRADVEGLFKQAEKNFSSKKTGVRCYHFDKEGTKNWKLYTPVLQLRKSKSQETASPSKTTTIISPRAPPERGAPLDQLKIVTYNVWFEPFHKEERASALAKILENQNADVVCLQEATPDFLNIIADNEFVRERYFITSSPGDDEGLITPYGTLMLISREIKVLESYLWSFPTNMNRYLQVADVEFRSKSNPEVVQTLSIATSHLESMSPNGATRASQLKIAGEKLATSPNAVFVGDFNFCAYQAAKEMQEVQAIKEGLSEFTDVWEHLNPGEPGFTFDTNVNKMLTHEETKRYDKVLVKNADKTWKIVSFEMLGTTPFMKNLKGDAIYPSDHFGISVVIQL